MFARVPKYVIAAHRLLQGEGPCLQSTANASTTIPGQTDGAHLHPQSTGGPGLASQPSTGCCTPSEGALTSKTLVYYNIPKKV